MTASKALSTEQLINELQTRGVRLEDAGHGAPSRRGGAGPSDHKALSIDGRVVMIPVHTAGADQIMTGSPDPRAPGWRRPRRSTATSRRRSVRSRP